MSLSLLPKSIEKEITAKLGGKTSVLGNAISVAKLYVAVGHEWKDTDIMGALVFCQDRETKCQFVRIYDLNTLVLRFQAEISYDPVYTVESEFFHTLELENNTVGFLHSHGTVSTPNPSSQLTITEARRFASAITRFRQGQEELKEAKQLFQAMAPQQGGRRRGSSAWNMLKSAIGVGGGDQKPVQSAMVSTPMNFVHVSHVGINPDGTMDVNQCPAEWKQHLKDAGVKKKDMLNPDFNKQVVKTLSVMAPLGGGGAVAATATSSSYSNDQSFKTATVKYDFTANDSKQLTVNVGEVLIVNKEYGDGWSKVTRQSDSRVGMVPTNYLDASTATPASAIPQARPPSTGTPVARSPPQQQQVASVVNNGLPPRPMSQRPVPQRPPVAAPAVAAAVEEQQPQYEPEPEPEPVPRELTPPPKPVNPLLAGIAGFNKDALVKAEAAEKKPAAPNLLDSIRAGQTLRKTEVVEKKAAPNLLDSIKAGSALKKVERVESTGKPPVPAAHTEPSLGNIFSDALAKIRSDIIGDDDDDEDDAGSDWD